MGGELEIGTCDICGKQEVPVSRKYYYYPHIKCECHGPNHFDLVRHCKNCKPHPPRETRIVLSHDNALKLDKILEQYSENEN